jgi:hypothetical protein
MHVSFDKKDLTESVAMDARVVKVVASALPLS